MDARSSMLNIKKIKLRGKKFKVEDFIQKLDVELKGISRKLV